MFALTDGIDETPDSKQDDISEELQEFGNCHHSEAEPKAEHSTKIRHVLCTLYTVYTVVVIVSSTQEIFKHP